MFLFKLRYSRFWYTEQSTSVSCRDLLPFNCSLLYLLCLVNKDALTDSPPPSLALQPPDQYWRPQRRLRGIPEVFWGKSCRASLNYVRSPTSAFYLTMSRGGGRTDTWMPSRRHLGKCWSGIWSFSLLLSTNSCLCMTGFGLSKSNFFSSHLPSFSARGLQVQESGQGQGLPTESETPLEWVTEWVGCGRVIIRIFFLEKL